MDKPFAILEQWVREGRIHLSQEPPGEAIEMDDEPREFAAEVVPEGLSDGELFEFAMKNVKALGWSAVPLHNRPPVEIQAQDGIEANARGTISRRKRRGAQRSGIDE